MSPAQDIMENTTQNDVLKQAVVDILKTATESITTGVDFLSAQLPEVIHQLLMWKMIESLIGFIVGIGLLIGGLLFVKRAVARECNGDLMLSMLSYLVFFLFCGIIVPNFANLNWLQIMVAPKLYLIEYTAELIK